MNREVRIYYPNIALFDGDLPNITDPLMVQQVLSPTVQWQMLHWYHVLSKVENEEDFLTMDLNNSDLPHYNSIISPKPRDFENAEADYAISEWRMFSRDYMNKSAYYFLLKNPATRYSLNVNYAK